LGRGHGDWDLATDLMPEQVMARARAAGFRCIPTGLQHGTVTALYGGEGFEITTFREDLDYLDGRRPEGVRLGVTLEEDLSRRDFTINALALPLEAVDAPDWRDRVVDPFGGRADLAAGVIRAVGDPLKRFAEDGLRPLRACRFAAQLGFALDPATLAAVPARLEVARKVAAERVFTELDKLLRGRHPAKGLTALEATGLLDLWLPELRPMVGCGQNRHHRYPVWNHTLRVLEELAADGNSDAWPPRAWAALLHDVGKPLTRREEVDGTHFHDHEAVSVNLADGILRRLKASHELLDRVKGLIRRHGEHPKDAWSEAAWRRLLQRLQESGVELEDWHALRLADNLAKGWGDAPEAPSPDNGLSGDDWRAEVRRACGAVIGRLMDIREARPPLSAKDLALDGRALMALAGRSGGPWLGKLQKDLLAAVIEDPDQNTPEALSRLAAEALNKAPGA
jgi:putative nucleotidyltransferase with HDIG domain